MWPFDIKTKDNANPYNDYGIPRYIILPTYNGRWKLCEKQTIFLPHAGLRFYFSEKATYASKEEAQADVIHLGLNNQ